VSARRARWRLIARFDGWIAGVGTTTGLRVVIGHWARSPFGPFTDVMIEQPSGWRVLLAPTERIAGFVAGTYRFDEVRTVHVTAARDRAVWQVTAPPVELTFDVGGRSLLGVLLRAVPRRLATTPGWISTIDQVVRRVLPGVRTRGSAAGHREELYAALDLHPITRARVLWEGVDQGGLAAVVPPVRFGFGSTPPAPSLVRVVTLVREG
jgi:hypothetical protein